MKSRLATPIVKTDAIAIDLEVAEILQSKEFRRGVGPVRSTVELTIRGNKRRFSALSDESLKGLLRTMLANLGGSPVSA
jgi:hypothetical protein